MKIIGCYAQTEMGHGSNVRGLQTTATYDKTSQNFVLSTPTLQSMKWWPGTIGKVATHAAVYAQLIIDGKGYGVHCFMLQLRDEHHRPLPGIELGDLGPKCGDNANDTGFMRLRDVRIPRENLFSKYQHVTAEGKYVKSKKGGSDKAHYATMVSARGNMTKTAGGKLAIAATIATRYSCVRKQGFQDPTTSEYFAEEKKILDHQVQRYRVLKQVALTYAMKFTGTWMISNFSGVDKQMRGGAEENQGALQEVFATSSGLKGLCTYLACQGIEDLRKCCGGNGYLLSSGIGSLEGDYKWQTTAEGDFIILMLQTARFLLKSLDKAKSDGGKEAEGPSGLCAYLGVVGEKGFSLEKAAPLMPSCAEDFMDVGVLISLWRYRALVAVVSVGEKVKEAQGKGASYDAAFNQNAIELVEAVKIHCLFSMLVCFAEETDKVEDQQVREVLGQLCALYGASQLLDSNGGGLFSVQQHTELQNAVARLLEIVRPNAVPLVDAFDIPDRVLNSTIGRYDGNVYEALYESALKSPLNKQDPFPGYEQVLRPYLDVEYLKKGREKMATEQKKGTTTSKL